MVCSGVELLKRFQEEFAKYEKERQELTNAERLFGLSITMYPELLQMEKELKGLEQIFNIYTNQQVGDIDSFVCRSVGHPSVCLSVQPVQK